MMVNSAVVTQWSGTLLPATDELTDREITDRYGSLMQAAVLAFRQDPEYVVQMAETAASIKARRGVRQSQRAS